MPLCAALPMLMGATALLTGVVLATPLSAQEKAANVAAYCVQNYGAGTLSTVDRRDNSPMCSEPTSQGLGLLHHKINPANICRKLHNTDRYRQAGPRIYCITGNEPVAKKDKVDLAKHCRESYGHTAIVSRRLTDNKPLCTVKGSGGLFQTHYPIDLAGLCGIGGSVSPTVVDGDTLDCSKTGTVAGSEGGGGEGSGRSNAPGKGKPASGEKGPDGQKQPGGTAKVPKEAIIPISDNPDLTGCGFARGLDLKELTANIPDPPKRWEIGATATRCPALTDGFKPDLDAFCQGEGSEAEIPDNRASALPDGRPICHPNDYFPDAQHQPGYWLMVGAVCAQMYPDKDQLRRAKLDGKNNPIRDADGQYVPLGRLIPITKYTGGEVECFYIDVESGKVIKDVTATMD